jgi:hypothetical protein
MRYTIAGTVQRRAVPPGDEAGFRDGAFAIHLIGDFDHPVLFAQARDD